MEVRCCHLPLKQREKISLTPQSFRISISFTISAQKFWFLSCLLWYSFVSYFPFSVSLISKKTSPVSLMLQLTSSITLKMPLSCVSFSFLECYMKSIISALLPFKRLPGPQCSPAHSGFPGCLFEIKFFFKFSWPPVASHKC